MTQFDWQGKPACQESRRDRPPDLRSIVHLQAPVLVDGRSRQVWPERPRIGSCLLNRGSMSGQAQPARPTRAAVRRLDGLARAGSACHS
jgi:hypothetical protein